MRMSLRSAGPQEPSIILGRNKMLKTGLRILCFWRWAEICFPTNIQPFSEFPKESTYFAIPQRSNAIPTPKTNTKIDHAKPTTNTPLSDARTFIFRSSRSIRASSMILQCPTTWRGKKHFWARLGQNKGHNLTFSGNGNRF